MIRFEDVTKEYQNSIKALDCVSFTISEGEFVFLVGQSGAGKSTIVKALIKYEIVSSGKIYYRDKDIVKLSRKELNKLRREIGVVFQDFKLITSRTIRENIEFALEASGKSDKDIDETTDYVLELVGLTNRSNLFPVQLSGGEKQKASIARAMANNPKTLVADEPTGNLDPSATWDLVQLLNKINSWGTTVIMATHDQEIVDSLNKRVIELQDGRIIRDDARKGTYKRNLRKETKTNKDNIKSQSKSKEKKKVSKKKADVKLTDKDEDK